MSAVWSDIILRPTDMLPDDSGPPWRTISEIQTSAVYREGLAPITTGYASLDAALHGGFRPECVYVLAGRTGSAKSTLAANIVRRVALHGHTVLLFKLEEPPVEAAWRMHAAASGLRLSAFLDGETFSDDERERFADGLDLLRELPIRLSDARDLDDMRKIARMHTEHSGRLIVVDQLGLIDVPDVKTNFERVTAASNALRLLARRRHVPLVVVAQVNRVAARAGERLTCHDLRDSGEIENDAAAVLLIDHVDPPDVRRSPEDPFTLNVVVGKNRYGPMTGPDDEPIRLSWWPATCRVEDVGGAT